jgi:hypothetical protein
MKRCKSLLAVLLVVLVSSVFAVDVYAVGQDITVAYSAFNSSTESLVALAAGNYTETFVMECNLTGLVWNSGTANALAQVRVYDGAVTDFLSLSYKHNSSGWFAEASVKVNNVTLDSYSATSAKNGTLGALQDRLIVDGNYSKIYMAGDCVLSVNNGEQLVIDNYDVQGATSSWSSGNAYLHCQEYTLSYRINVWIPVIVSFAMLGMIMGLLKKFGKR